MRTGIRMILCTCLAAIAVTMAVFTLADFSPEEPGGTQGYVLGVADGNVAVYGGGDMKRPVAVTDIELAGLREADRDLISQGLAVATQEELVALLEDLGS